MNAEVMDILKKFPQDKVKEIIKLASKEENAAGITKIAESYGVSISEEQADTVLKAISEKVEVKGDDLDKVSGGWCDSEC